MDMISLCIYVTQGKKAHAVSKLQQNVCVSEKKIELQILTSILETSSSLVCCLIKLCPTILISHCLVVF